MTVNITEESVQRVETDLVNLLLTPPRPGLGLAYRPFCLPCLERDFESSTDGVNSDYYD